MGLIKLALDNEHGYSTSRVWKARGKGAAAGAVSGAVAGTFLAARTGNPLLGLGGAGIGALTGMAIGDIATSLKQNKEYAQRHGSKHPNLQTINPLTSLRMYKHTPMEESLKQLDLYGAGYGIAARLGGLKDMKRPK